MDNDKNNSNPNKGIFMGLKARFEKNRIGELLVARNKISQDELNSALCEQQKQGRPLGEYLYEAGLISKAQLRATLMEQMAYRALAVGVTLYFSAVSFGGVKSAHAGEKNASKSFAQVAYNYNATNPEARGVRSSTTTTTSTTNQNIQMASLQTGASRYIAPNYNNPEKLFGSREVRSSNMRAFTKWNGVMERLDNAGLQNWGTDLTKFQALPTQAKIRAVNNYVNKIRYIEDRNNWSQSDYWATPAEFFARGGDCEDFAIAKFAALKKLGVPESQMRLAIVQDKVKNIPHAILIVYTDEGAVMLDNQIKTVEQVSSVSRYKPIYSINRDAWWRHIAES